MNNREAFEVIRRDKLEELLDEYFDLAVEKGRNFERNGLRSNQVRKEILSLFDLASQAQQEPDKNLQNKSKEYLISKIVMLQNASKADDRAIKASDILIESLKVKIAVLESQAQQTESQWISVEERLPDHRNDVLCFVVSNQGDTSIKSSHLNPAMTGFYVEYEFDEPIEKVTHWMPLPPAPEGDKPCEQK